MKRLLAWLGGALGGLAAYRAFTRRRSLPAAPVAVALAGPDPRAEELRARLAEARLAGDDREEFEAGETPVDRVADPVGDPAERRRAVHEEGRAALDEMRPPDASS